MAKWHTGHTEIHKNGSFGANLSVLQKHFVKLPQADGEIGSGEIVALVPADRAVAMTFEDDPVEEGEAVEESTKRQAAILVAGDREKGFLVERGWSVCSW